MRGTPVKSCLSAQETFLIYRPDGPASVVSGHAGGHAGGHTDGHAPGHADGHASGHADGPADGHADVTRRVVDAAPRDETN